MLVPYKALSEGALDNMIAEYCTRFWGLNDEVEPLKSRKEQVLNALESGSLVIMTFKTQAPSIVPSEGLKVGGE